jgi:hypothetical protein
MIKMIKPKTYGLRKFIGYIVLLPGLLFLIIGIAGFWDKTPDKSEQAILLVLGIFESVGGVLLIYAAIKKEKESKNRFAETTIFNLAKENNGILNTIDVSIFTKLPEAECEQMLNYFVTKGHAIPDVNEKGFVEYKFPVYLKD